LNQLRSFSKRTNIPVEEEKHQPSLNPHNSGSDLERKELALKLNKAVEALPEQRKIIFRLVKENGLKCREVAQILNISRRTVENQMFKAVKTLADALTPYLGYNPQKRISGKQMMSFLFF
jgi:RNA polymerase sigma factor (sigma-70 family)